VAGRRLILIAGALTFFFTTKAADHTISPGRAASDPRFAVPFEVRTNGEAFSRLTGRTNGLPMFQLIRMARSSMSCPRFPARDY
jgi:hypothetical protein